MINVYDNLRDSEGNIAFGRTKLFVKNTLDDGSVNEYISGISCVPEDNGTMFIVDAYVVAQIDKVQFVDGQLSVKEGEIIEEPKKSDVELKEEELLRQLAELRAQKGNHK